MANEIEIIQHLPDALEPRREAGTDEQLVELWLHGLSRHTQRAYRKDWEDFRGSVKKSLHCVSLMDIQKFGQKLSCDRPDLTHGSRHRKLSSLKSLFSFGHRLGYLLYDVAKPLRLPAVRDTLNERIMTEGEVQRLIAVEQRPRNRAILVLLYASGVRVGELVALKWRDVQPRAEAGQITVFGKGGKTRAILLPVSTWLLLLSIRTARPNDASVFASRRGGGHLDESAVLRVVKAAAHRAGIEKAVSPHWLRHGHASHALDRGAPIHLVQATLGHSSVATTGRYLHARPNESSGTYLPL